MATELPPAEQYLYVRLSGDAEMRALAPGGFRSEMLPDLPAGVAMLWTYQGSLPDVSAAQGVRVLTRPLYLVRAVLRTRDPNDLESAAARADALLHRGPIMTLPSGVIVRSCVRESPYSWMERIADVQWRYLGGYYRLQLFTPAA